MLKVVALQANLVWENPEENRQYFKNCFDEIAEHVDLVVLPEMFTSGFTMEPKPSAEKMDGKSVKWMQDCAKRYQFLLTGSLIIQENGAFYNRMIFAFPNGAIEYYDKRHLFRMGKEHEHYTAGIKKLIVNYKGWRIFPQICYDLRFPLWSYNRNEYDLLIYVANFPAVRRNVWNSLLLARAIENQCYVVGCNRIGIDGNELVYDGGSQVISPKGKIIAKATYDTPETLSANLSLEKLQAFREKFPIHLDADNFELV
ncbi:putative amidohydrolase [Balneicella halophila]|uniref:Omega-amidase YafV n=1 Tax=Balneicella halophila TaxID=1537566 RepID=A0A7L4USF7_BALHA|nr:amidohydrolase [Balneicella halophila]PVX52629.1 putative amidohydrolase [Balneicella halophila]